MPDTQEDVQGRSKKEALENPVEDTIAAQIEARKARLASEPIREAGVLPLVTQEGVPDRVYDLMAVFKINGQTVYCGSDERGDLVLEPDASKIDAGQLRTYTHNATRKLMTVDLAQGHPDWEGQVKPVSRVRVVTLQPGGIEISRTQGLERDFDLVTLHTEVFDETTGESRDEPITLDLENQLLGPIAEKNGAVQIRELVEPDKPVTRALLLLPGEAVGAEDEVVAVFLRDIVTEQLGSAKAARTAASVILEEIVQDTVELQKGELSRAAVEVRERIAQSPVANNDRVRLLRKLLGGSESSQEDPKSRQVEVSPESAKKTEFKNRTDDERKGEEKPVRIDPEGEAVMVRAEDVRLSGVKVILKRLGVSQEEVTRIDERYSFISFFGESTAPLVGAGGGAVLGVLGFAQLFGQWGILAGLPVGIIGGVFSVALAREMVAESLAKKYLERQLRKRGVVIKES